MAKRERGTISPEQIQGALRQGDNNVVLMAKGVFVPGNLVATDADGNAVDSGGTGGGFISPTTTKGDLIVHDGTDDTRLPAGTDGQVLVADSTETLGVKWETAAGGRFLMFVNNEGISSDWTMTVNDTWPPFEVNGVGV